MESSGTSEKESLGSDEKGAVQSKGWRFDKNKEVVYCSYFIKRKKRKCTHRVSVNSDGFCSEHSPAGLEESRVADMNARMKHECSAVLSGVIDRISLINNEEANYVAPKTKKMRVSAPKRMANPFSVDLTPSISHILASDMFTQPNLPLHIDIGCAKGRCIERMSKRPERKHWNHLGVEIRGRTVEEAMQRITNDCKQRYYGSSSDVDEEKNLYFLTCNFAASVAELLGKFPRESLQLISIQFPDPWKRKKHLRRLLVQKKMVKQLSECLPRGAIIYISSDCDKVATWMVDRFMECEEDDKSGSEEVDFPKKKCFRLLSSISDLDRVRTPGIFMKQELLDTSNSIQIPDSNISSESSNSDDDTISKDGEKSSPSYSWFDSKVNPLGELSERELVCEVDWRDVRRCCFERV